MTFTLITSIIGIIILGTILNNIMPKIPTSLFQVILGALFAIYSFNNNFEIETETFMALVIAPLLFTDAYKLSRSKFWLYRTPILFMAIALVLITVLVVGYIINILLPNIPLAASFALAAILSPTDAVAVKSITKGMKLPKGLMDILEGESLLNDAAGIVSFNIALATVLSGTFSITSATQKFLFVALGGAFIGLLLGLLFLRIKSILNNLVGSESSSVVIYTLVVPIFSFLIAEHIHVSGIVAVVTTGIIFNLEKDVWQQENINSEFSLLNDSNITTIGYILNGFVFVYLGYLLPDIFIKMYEHKELSLNIVLLYIVIITLTMMLLRYTLVYLFYPIFQVHTFTSLQKIASALTNRKFDAGKYSRKHYALIASLCGIHGTITLATALLIPITLNSGEPFPYRNTILFIASCVVILSMIIGSIFLPLTIKQSNTEPLIKENYRKIIIEKSIEEITKTKKEYIPSLTNDKVEDKKRKLQLAYGMIIKKLQEQAIFFSDKQDRNRAGKDIKKILKAINHLEKEHLEKLKTEKKISSFLANIIKIRILRRNKLLTYSMFSHMILQIKLSITEINYRRAIQKEFLKNSIRKIIKNKKNKRELPIEKEQELINKMLSDTSQRLFNNLLPTIEEFNNIAYDYLDNDTEHNKESIKLVRTTIENFKHVLFVRFINDPKSYKEEYEKLTINAIWHQKQEILKRQHTKNISKHDAENILRSLNYSEALLFSEE